MLKKHAKVWLGPLAPVISSSRYATKYTPLSTELCVPTEALGRVSFARDFVRHLPELGVPKHRAAIYDDPIWSTVEHVFQASAITPAMRSLHAIDDGTTAMLASERTFSFLGLDNPDPAALAMCRIRHLGLSVSYSNASRVPTCIAGAARANPILTEVTFAEGDPRNWEQLWDFLDLDLPHVVRVTVLVHPGRLEFRLRDRHLAIYPDHGDAQHWDRILGPLRSRRFARVEILPGAAAEIARRFSPTAT